MASIDKLAQEVIEFKMSVFEEYAEEKLMPLMEMVSLGKVIRKPFWEWSARQIELATQLYGQQQVEQRKVHDYNKRVTALEAEVEEMENG